MRAKGLWSEALAMPSDAREGQAPAPGDPGPGGRDGGPLVARRMHDSYCEIHLPFASSPEFLETYTNASGGIRTGLLMEHLDSLAGSIAYKHILGPTVPELPKAAGFYVVTASVDRCVFLSGTVHKLDYLLARLYTPDWTCLRHSTRSETCG